MPRLQTEDPPQRGRSTGAPRKRGAAEPLPRSSKAPRKRVAENKHRKKPSFPSPRSQGELATRHKGIQKLKKKARKVAARKLADEFGVGPRYARDAASKLILKQPLASRKGKQFKPYVIGEEEEELIFETLKEHGFTLTFRQLGEKVGIPKSTINDFMRRKKWRQVKKGTVPHLTDECMAARLEWAKEREDDEFECQVDLDEKWFYVWTDRVTAKLPPGYVRPKSKIKSKRYIGKIMVMTAIARPCPEHQFSGLVGIWRVCDRRPAKINRKPSAVHPQGLVKGVTIITEEKSLDGPRFEKMLAEDVIPACRSKLSWATKIKLQFDNAPGHLTKGKTDKETGEKVFMSTIAGKLKSILEKSGEIPIELVRQIANSPDTNLNDLGFYNSMDSLMPHWREFVLDSFEKQVETAFWAYPSEKLERLVRKKIAIIKEIIGANGDNTYKIPHTKKE